MRHWQSGGVAPAVPLLSVLRMSFLKTDIARLPRAVPLLGWGSQGHVRQYLPAGSGCPCRECVGNPLLIRSQESQTVTAVVVCIHFAERGRSFGRAESSQGPLGWCCGSLSRLRTGPRPCLPP